MLKKDLLVVLIIGALVGILIQPVLITLGPSLEKAGLSFDLSFRAGIFVFLSLIAPLALYIAYLLSKVWGVLYQFAKFAAVGVLNTLIDFGVLNVLIVLTAVAGGWQYSLFKAFSFLAATTNSFFWNKFWTFESRERTTASQTLSFYSVAIVAWLANVLIASLIVNFLNRPASVSVNLWANVGALFGVAGSFLIDFLGYKYVVFKSVPDEV